MTSFQEAGKHARYSRVARHEAQGQEPAGEALVATRDEIAERDAESLLGTPPSGHCTLSSRSLG